MEKEFKEILKKCLNPCFCGIYSQSDSDLSVLASNSCLNPCFCGIYSQRMRSALFLFNLKNVLILVFVEFTLRENT